MQIENGFVVHQAGGDFGYCGADTYVRLSYAASTNDLHKAIEQLGRLMRRIGGG